MSISSDSQIRICGHVHVLEGTLELSSALLVAVRFILSLIYNFFFTDFEIKPLQNSLVLTPFRVLSPFTRELRYSSTPEVPSTSPILAGDSPAFPLSLCVLYEKN
jgi:hypothetical protein